MGDDAHKKFSDDANQHLIEAHNILHKALPVILILLLIYLYFKLISPISHPVLSYLELGILGFFASEIIVDFFLYENNRQFLKDKWINIILILPFFAAFRAAGRIGQLLVASRSLEILQFAWLAEIPVVARAMEGVRASRLAYYTSYIQKSMHGVVDGGKIIKGWFRKSTITTKVIAMVGITSASQNTDNNKHTTKDDSEETTDKHTTKTETTDN